MIIMEADAAQDQINGVIKKAKEKGLDPRVIDTAQLTAVAVNGKGSQSDLSQFGVLPGVKRVMSNAPSYKLASREFHPQDSPFPLKKTTVKRGEVLLIAGPCSVENRTQILETAHAVQEAGAHALRGGAFKPRTSPYSFQGLEEEGLRYLADAREVTGLPVVTEVMSPEDVSLVGRYADVLQIGARNMQNYPLLRAAGDSGKPVLLKRGMMASLDELLLAAEYILAQGNNRVMVCERGIRTFSRETRYTADINALPVLKAKTHLPVIFDPSHSTGHWRYVSPLALAAVAAGVDGLLVEIHPRPGEALSDGRQSLKPERFQELVGQVKRLERLMVESMDWAGRKRAVDSCL